MELFNKRYFCLLAFAFVMSAFFCCFVSSAVKIVLSCLAFLAGVAIAVLFAKKKISKFKSVFLGLLALSILGASFSSYFFISRAERKAESVLGENTVMLRILMPENENAYTVRVLRVGNEELDIKGELYIDIDEEFEYGDELILRGMVDRNTDVFDRSKLLHVSADIGELGVYVDKGAGISYFSVDGVRSLCFSMQRSFADFVDGAFGEYGAMVKGLLVNDKSDIDEKTVLDFKRSGTSHIMAVSGMHIALLMGAIELLLRAFMLKKEIRIAFVSVFAILFLALTAFSASAVRSVIMLYAVYLTYLLGEENDAITALFASIAIIILFSPYSVYDLGMWMSFLATLGILLVYSYFESRLPYPKNENKLLRYSLRFLLACLKSIMLTVIANFFLLPIMWIFFGTFSISTIPCNLLLGPIVAVLLPLCAISMLLSPIPFLGDGLVFVTKRMIDLMLSIIRFFSEMRFGVVSLSHIFAGVLITAFAITMVVMMLIKMKRKLLIFVPMIAFAVLFVGCFSIFSATAKAEIKYLKSGKSELLFVNCGAECSVFDLGDDSSYDGIKILNGMSKYATEIDEYFIVNPSSNDVKTISKVMKNTIIRKIYLPTSFEYSDLNYFKGVLNCADFYGIEVDFFEPDEIVEICNNVSFSDIDGEKISLFSDAASIGFFEGRAIYSYAERTYDVNRSEDISLTLPFE